MYKMEIKQIIAHLPYDSAFASKSCGDEKIGFLWRNFFKQIKLDSPVEISCFDWKYTQEVADFLDGNGFQVMRSESLNNWIKYKVVPL